jgi:tetratricopeptide (TPR) repeat protein
MRFIVFTSLIGWLALVARFSPLLAAAPDPTTAQQLDDSIEPLVPKTVRPEEDEDRLTAAALFSAGRTLEQRDKEAEALKRYLRALRYAPDAKPILREMLPLAFSLERRDVALRYLAAHLDEANITDPLLLRAAADYLADSGNWPSAEKIYRQVEQLIAGEKPSAAQVLVQMELGRMNFLNGKFTEAASAYKQVLEALLEPKKFGLDAATQKTLVGDDGELFELMGSVFLEAKQPDDARKAFDLLQKRKADNARHLLNAARVELAAGKPQLALDALQKYFDANKPSDSITPYEVLAGALKDLNQSDQLVPRLEALYKSQPKNSTLAFYLGEEYRKAKRDSDAARLLQAAVEAQPMAEAYQSLSKILRPSGDAKDVLKLLASVAKKTGSLSALEDETKGIIQDEKLLSAILTAAKAEHGDANEEDAPALRAGALLASEAKRWDEAEALTNLAIKADPKSASGLLMAFGLDLFMSEQYERAAAVFQRGADEKSLPDEKPDFYYYLAGALAMNKQPDEALAAAEQAAAKKPDDPRFVSRPAWILYHAKRYHEAEKAYKVFIENYDDDFITDGARDAVQQAKMVMSNLYVQQHDIPKAVEYLEQVLDEFPDDAGANNDLGYLWADENQHLKRAHRMIQLAVADEPENAAYRDSLGWALFRLGRYSEALEELQKAVELEKADSKEPDATVLEHLGDVHQKLGRTSDAIAAWKQSIEAYQREKESDKIKAVELKLKALEKPPPASGDK